MARRCKERVDQKNMYAVSYCTLLLLAGAFAGASLSPSLENPYMAALLIAQSAFLFITSVLLLSFVRVLPTLVERAMLARMHSQADAAAYGLVWSEASTQATVRQVPYYMPAFNELLTVVESTVEEQRMLLSDLFPARHAPDDEFLPEDEPAAALEPLR